VCAAAVRVLVKQAGDLDMLYQMRDCRDSTVTSYEKSLKQIFQKKKISFSGHVLCGIPQPSDVF